MYACIYQKSYLPTYLPYLPTYTHIHKKTAGGGGSMLGRLLMTIIVGGLAGVLSVICLPGLVDLREVGRYGG